MPKLTNEAVTVEPLDAAATVEVLNRILHFELDGVMQQFHHRWMSRWLRPARARAITVGQLIASLTGGTSVAVGQLTDDALASSENLLTAARRHERRRTDEYRRLLELVEGRSDELEAFARAQIAAAEKDASEQASGE
jgi:biotin-(acetyl-CoA carboxylase) ligase